MATSTLTSKGQITIPKDIRERMDLKRGDRLEVSIDDEGRIIMCARRTRPGVCGILSAFKPERPVSVEEMNEAVRRRAAGKAKD